jgi:tryptophanyl-tRNA synthetase
VKKFLAAGRQETLEPIRQRRAEFAKDIPAVIDILRRGTETAREAGAQTMSEVRRAMRLDYFDDAAFTAEQAARFA